MVDMGEQQVTEHQLSSPELTPSFNGGVRGLWGREESVSQDSPVCIWVALMLHPAPHFFSTFRASGSAWWVWILSLWQAVQGLKEAEGQGSRTDRRTHSS